MIKIAICDDEKYMIDDIGIRIMDYFDDDKEKFELFEFSNGADFLSFYNEEGKTDIIFMDIEIGDKNGVEIIAKIREIDEDVVVIFVTSHTAYVNQAFRVGAFQYINKPIDEQFLIQEMDRACRMLLKSNSIISFPSKCGAEYVRVKDIVYCESQNKITAIQLRNGSVKEVMCCLSKCLDSLECFGVFRCHRCYIVNIEHVVATNSQFAELNDSTHIPIGRKYRLDFDKAINRFINKRSV